MVPPPLFFSLVREPEDLEKACNSLDREPQASASRNVSLHMNISRGMSRSDGGPDCPAGVSTKGGLRSCHRTRFTSNFGSTLCVRGRSISNRRIQSLMTVLSVSSGDVCFSTDSIADL